MSEIEIRIGSGSIAPASPGRARPRSRSGQSRLNDILLWALLVVVALSPLPFGSVRPFISGLWALYVGVAGAIYMLALTRAGESLRRPVSDFGVPALLMTVFVGYLVIQLVPFGLVLGAIPVLSAGDWVATTPQISIAPDMTVLMLIRQLTYGLFFLLALQVLANDGRRMRFLVLALAVCTGYALFGMISLHAGDTLLGLPKWAYFNVATGPFVNRNSFATFLSLGAVLALGMAGGEVVRRWQRHRHDGTPPNFWGNLILYVVAYLGLLVVILATESRMGLVACLAGSLVVVLLTIGAMRRLGPLLYALPVTLIAGTAVFLSYGKGFFERLETLDTATEIRGELYQQVMELIMLRPWTGFGGGTFGVAFPIVHAPPVNPDYVWERAHSSYLSLFAETGLIFGLLPVLALGWIAWRMLANLVRGKGSWTSQAIAIGAITVAAVHSTVDFSLEVNAVTFLFLTVVAAGLASASRREA